MYILLLLLLLLLLLYPHDIPRFCTWNDPQKNPAGQQVCRGQDARA
jgi:cell division protein FtsW (lipid II flippase)